jgi:phosphoadenosine phosphosulfate reductase
MSHVDTSGPVKLTAGLNTAFSSIDLPERLALLRQSIDGRLVFTTSFGLEDQIIAHHIFESGLSINVVTLDTGRLFPQTYKLWSDTEAKYARRIKAFYPNTADVEELVADQGIDGFFFSVDMRKACCNVRKVKPLARALAGAGAWITGLRGDASEHRQHLDFVSFDAQHNLIKANPLYDWSRERALAHAEAHDIPINPLHGRGFLSIGCAPCTRPIQPGETERAGRWWWESENQKECGLHVAEPA